MADYYRRFLKALDWQLTPFSRVLVLIAAVLVVISLFVPLWHMTFVAQQYPEGLDLWIYSHDLIGGDDGNDLTEINVLNHYIGMAELQPADFNELKWMPLVIGLIVVFTLRVAVIGDLRSLADLLVLSGYFGVFSLWSFWYRLGYYGENLDPKASVQVEPFMPPIFGYKLVGQFDVWSYPTWGAYLFFGYGLLLVTALWLTWRSGGRGVEGDV
jgi:copper chaperone NosL